jgi:preprotein translocase subunit YajC
MMNFSSLLLPLIIVLFAVPLFMGTRKQKRAAAQQSAMQSSLNYGDRVMTTSGLYGTVVTTSTDSIDIEIAPGVVTSWLRAAVREKVADSVIEAPEDSYEDSDEETYTADDAADAPHTDATAKAGDVETDYTTKSTADIAPPLEDSSKKAR